MKRRFSDRIGATRPPQLHREEMTEELRTALWNTFHEGLFASRQGGLDWRPRLEAVYRFLNWRVHDLTFHENYETDYLEKWYFNEEREWYEIYNLVDFVAPVLARGTREPEKVFAWFNRVLEQEGSAYRFVGGELTTITDGTEAASVNEAARVSDRFSGGREHIVRALQLLGQRPQPDFRNTIKEAISAVESTLKVLTGKGHADLSAALKDFAAKYPIHGALASGLDKLYGYTSNEHGLRHALLEAAASVGYAEAKFMVVACAAFMNFLIARTAP